jgi:hypothetical protein
MDNEELKREADGLMTACRLADLLASYPQWFVGGSYSYDLMVWRDLDVYVLDLTHDLKVCFEVALALTERLPAWKSRFTNNLGREPNGYYWGLKTGDERAGAWKLDVWFLDRAGFDAHRRYAAAMNERLTAETRAAICAIKESYWRRAEYRDTVTSEHIYRAVLDGGVRGVDEFEKWLAGSACNLLKEEGKSWFH